MKRALLALTLALAAGAAADEAPVDGNLLDRRPKVVSQAAPEFPFELARSGYRGEVLVDFIVDKEGNVVRAGVLKSTHPDFEAPAVEAVLKWKFKPGIKDGHPVYVHMAVPVVFESHTGNGPLEGWPMWQVPHRASKELPVEFQYDEPPTPSVMAAPVYPFELLRAGKKGKATVRFAIDPAGQTHFLKLENATLPEFGLAARAMVEAWVFEPAKKDGKPCWALLEKEQVFDRDQSEFPQNESAERLLKDLRRNPCPILAVGRDLDRDLHGRFQPSPVVPDELRKSRTRAEAIIEFVIDRGGHAQLPRIVSATDPDFGWSAATAIERWQYTQPLKAGKPVDIFVRVPIVYNPAPDEGS
jgi:TonB family protein